MKPRDPFKDPNIVRHPPSFRGAFLMVMPDTIRHLEERIKQLEKKVKNLEATGNR